MSSRLRQAHPRREYTVNNRDAVICTVTGVVLGALIQFFPATSPTFGIVLCGVGLVNGIVWGIEETDADLGRFNPVAFLDGVMSTMLGSVTVLAALSALLSCLDWCNGTTST